MRDLHSRIEYLSGHAQAFFYGFDIRLHLPEMSQISRLDVFSHAFDLFLDLRGDFGTVSDPQKDRGSPCLVIEQSRPEGVRPEAYPIL